MKEIKRYVCEICNTEYKDQSECEKCENTHCKPVKIIKAKYIAANNNLKGYPTSVIIKMADGTEQTYKR